MRSRKAVSGDLDLAGCAYGSNDPDGHRYDDAKKALVTLDKAITALREALVEQPAKQDIPDLIAGTLGVSRGTAYDLMREALAQERSSDEQPAPVAKPHEQEPAWRTAGGIPRFKPAPVQQEPEFFTHSVDQPYDWSEWVCPDPKGYLMKCCDCGLVHEAEFGVVRYKSETEREDCDMVDDPNLQAVFRMRRSEQWSPEDTAHRAGGLTMEQPTQQEPYCWMSPEGTIYQASDEDVLKGSIPMYLGATPAQQEPVGRLRMGPKQDFVTTGAAGDLEINVWHSVYTTPPAAQPAPVQDIEHCIWARNGNTPCPHTAAPVQDGNAFFKQFQTINER